MLSVAFAYEMARQNNVILFDLDFFNRGLTGLLRKGERVCEIARPAFLSGTSSDSGSWCLFRVAPRLYHVQYPDLTEEEIRSLETLSADELFSKLRDYVDYLAPEVKAEVIILDCHGGPDPLSFAACAVASPSILVSEPDKITFYGTMHFVRQLESSCGPDSIKNLHLVFNKVIPAFSIPYLRRFYDQKLRKLFCEKPLLSVIPLEVYLTKEFERVPFITSVFPYSELAKKVRLMTWDLFHKSAPELLSKSARHLNRLDRLTTRYALGKKPFFLNTDAIMAIIAVFALVGVAGYQWHESTGNDIGTISNYSKEVLLYQTALSNPSAVPEDCRVNDQERSAQCAMRTCSFLVFYVLSTSKGEVAFDKRLSSYVPPSEHGRCNTLLSGLPDEETAQRGADEIRWGRENSILSKQITSSAVQAPSKISVLLYELVGRTFAPTAMSLVLWFAFALILNWTAALDRAFTYSWRASKVTGVALSALCVFSLWFLCSFYYGTSGEMLRSVPIWLVAFGYVPAAAEVCHQLYRAFKQVLGERRLSEAGVRFAFAILLIAQPIVTKFVANKL